MATVYAFIYGKPPKQIAAYWEARSRRQQPDVSVDGLVDVRTPSSGPQI